MIYLRPVTSKEKNMSELNHLSTRHLDRIKRNICSAEECDIQILTSSSDIGVIRNGGRRGSNFGPQAILSNVFKMASHQTQNKFFIQEVSSNNFDQISDANRISPLIKNKKKIIHLGGGHDHVYPLLRAINQHYKKITVINIDAHLDTRIDKVAHSGTPFRQFAETVDGEFHLIQFGIHDFSNPDSSFNPLPKGKMEIAKSLHDLKNILTKDFEPDHALVFSLDCDAIEASIMEGVSAVNHKGIPFEQIEEILELVRKNKQGIFFGIYEYNPVYDNLSEKGSKAIASLIYGLLEQY